MHFRPARAACLLILALAAEAVAGAGGQCSSVGAHLSVDSSRNATGHLLTSLRFLQETKLPAGPARVLLDVRPTSTRCRGIRTDTLVVTLQAPPPPAGPGYEEITGIGFYKMHEEKVTWDEAKDVCDEEGSHLIILNSEEETAAIQKLIKTYPNVTGWIFAGFYKNKEGQFITIFGEKLERTGYTRWGSGQPDNAGNNENCGSIHPTTVTLNDLPCTNKAAFICEQIIA